VGIITSLHPVYWYLLQTTHKYRSRTYYLAAETEAEMNKWVMTLCRVLGLAETGTFVHISLCWIVLQTTAILLFVISLLLCHSWNTWITLTYLWYAICLHLHYRRIRGDMMDTKIKCDAHPPTLWVRFVFQ